VKTTERIEARRIRREDGLSMKEIARIVQEIEDFWLETTGLPRSRLAKSIVNVYSKQEETSQQASLRDVPARGLRHGGRAVHLRRDPRVRRLRPAAMA
jgi:hypothetical protein